MPKQYIQAYMTTDSNALTVLSKVGHLSHHHLKQCGMSDKRIKSFIKQGVIQKVTYRNIESKQLETCYKFTQEGKEFFNLREEKEHSFYQSVSAQHDMAIAEKYFSLNEYQRSTWLTESEIRNEFKEYVQELHDRGDFERAKELENMYANRQLSAVDAVYETEQGVRIAYEVITNSYGQEELRAKEEFVEIMKLVYRPERI